MASERASELGALAVVAEPKPTLARTNLTLRLRHYAGASNLTSTFARCIELEPNPKGANCTEKGKLNEQTQLLRACVLS